MKPLDDFKEGEIEIEQFPTHLAVHEPCCPINTESEVIREQPMVHCSLHIQKALKKLFLDEKYLLRFKFQIHLKL